MTQSYSRNLFHDYIVKIRMASFRATPCNDPRDPKIEHFSSKLKSCHHDLTRSHQIGWPKGPRQTRDNVQRIIQIEAESFIVPKQTFSNEKKGSNGNF